MQAHTLNVVLAAPCDAVFRLLADIEALPRWAAAFCERIDLVGGAWLALTGAGELYCELVADERTGVIDLRLGTGGEPPGLLPMRVLALPGGGTLISLTLLRSPAQSDAQFRRLRLALGRDLRALDGRIGAAPLRPDARAALASTPAAGVS